MGWKDVLFLLVVGIAFWCTSIIAEAVAQDEKGHHIGIEKFVCTNSNGPAVGTVVEFDDFILTANHVTSSCTDGQQEGWERFPTWDLAIKLKTSIENIKVPFQCMYQPEGRNVAFIGYPANWIGMHNSEVAVGVIMSEDPQFMIANGSLLVNDVQLAWTDRVRPGYSGGAVVTGDHTFAGIAIAVQNSRERGKPRGAFFVPTHTICAAFDTLYK
jgi:hypothetical protein